MALAVTSGSFAECTCGTAPGDLAADCDTGATVNGMIVLTVDMIAAEVNIGSFGECDSLLNPEVSSATAAAQGVLTPMPCVPVVDSSWIPGALMASQSGVSYVNDASICTCAWGGVISIVDALGVEMEIE